MGVTHSRCEEEEEHAEARAIAVHCSAKFAHTVKLWCFSARLHG